MAILRIQWRPRPGQGPDGDPSHPGYGRFHFPVLDGMIHGYVKVVDDLSKVDIEKVRTEILNYRATSPDGGVTGCCVSAPTANNQPRTELRVFRHSCPVHIKRESSAKVETKDEAGKMVWFDNFLKPFDIQ